MDAHRTFPATAEGVRESRIWAKACCDRWGCAAAADAVALVVDELAANAIVHGGTAPSVSMALGEGAVLGAVHDDGPGVLDLQPTVLDVERIGGWGLLVVQQLTESWSVDYDATGKTVHFRVPC
jgi:anti-sigma regulatory factor (Ser/Thr protein kinase)